MKKLSVFILVLLFLLVGCGGDKVPDGVTIKNGTGFFTFSGGINSLNFPEALKYFSTHDIRKVVMEIHSPGGNFYEMWRIIAWMEEYDDIEYETRAYGMFGSAGLLVYVAGDIRLISRYATSMWHDVQGSMPEEIKELFNDQNHAYLASRTELTVEQILEKIENAGGDWYFGAKEAIALGIAHGYID